MKNLSNNRLESIVITMHSLQQKYGGTKFETIVNLFESTNSSMTIAVNELRKRNLVIKEGRGKDAVYKITKAAVDLIDRNCLKSFIVSEKIAPTDKVVTLTKRYNQMAKEKIQLKKKLEETKKVNFFSRLRNLFK